MNLCISVEITQALAVAPAIVVALPIIFYQLSRPTKLVYFITRNEMTFILKCTPSDCTFNVTSQLEIYVIRDRTKR